MKKLIALALFSVTLIGCTVYPKTYTYSPAVSIGGSNEGNLVLPSPFSKNNPKTVETTIEKTLVPYEQSSHQTSAYANQPSPLTAYIPEPPPSVHYYPNETVVFLGEQYLEPR
jgi:hypothetical protein